MINNRNIGKIEIENILGEGMIFDSYRGKTEKTLNELLPKIKAILNEKVGPMAQDFLVDDEKMRPIMCNVYQALPFVVRMAVKEDSFVDYCFRNRDRLFEEDEKKALLPENTDE